MLLDVTLVNVTELAPIVVLLFDSSTELELLLTTTLIGTSGAVCRLTLMLPCMNWPIMVLLTVVVGWVTVAVIDWYCEGVLKVSCGPMPELIVGGPEMAIVVGAPPPTGWKLAVSEESPPLNITGLVTVPTPGKELDMGTPIGPMPGFSWPEPAYVRVPGFRITGSSVIFVAGDKVVVVMLPWLGLMMKPDGFTVTVPVPLA